MRSLVLAVIAALSLGACSHSAGHTPRGELCEFKRYSLEAPLPDEDELESILTGQPGDILLLSGGSQDGAFGTGFVDGWHRSGTMPDFKLVTGISTGALQSTGAFIKRPDISVDGYTINDESELLETDLNGRDIKPEFRLGAIYRLLVEGSISDLVPLRDELHARLTPEVLEAVAARHENEGAKLLAGATDVDLGVAVAFDLTLMAVKFANAEEGSDERDRWKDCYIKALVASSIVPPAAQPVFIDNRMYIDGGIRYAVFDDRMAELQRNMVEPPVEVAAAPPPGTPPADAPVARSVIAVQQQPRMFLILNHTGTSRAECQKIDEDDCVPANSTAGERKDWEVLALATRTLELFENQIRRLSLDRARQRARDEGMPFYFARIQSDHLIDPHRRYAIPDFEGEMHCEAWREVDDEEDDPLEFHKRYMRCLIEYGRERGLAADWDLEP